MKTKKFKNKNLVAKKKNYKVTLILALSMAFIGWLSLTQMKQDTAQVQYISLVNMLSNKKVAEAAEKKDVLTLTKSPFVQKIPPSAAGNLNASIPDTTIPVANVLPAKNSEKVTELMAVIYTDDGNNVAIISDTDGQRTVKVNDETAGGIVSEIGEKYITVGGIKIPLAKK